MMLRKTHQRLDDRLLLIGASMRPQHDAAENNPGEAPLLMITHASMRPQHDAAENKLS